jgi:hypothetical protein
LGTDRDHELTRIITNADWHNIPPPIFSLFQNFATHHIKKDTELHEWHTRLVKRNKQLVKTVVYLQESMFSLPT